MSPILAVKRGFGLRWCIAALVLSSLVLGGLAYVYHEWRPGTQYSGQGGRHRDQSGAAVGAHPSGVELQAAREAAQQALGSSGWEEASAMILDAERVRPLMSHYHKKHPWKPVSLVGPEVGTIETQNGRPRLRLSVQSDGGLPVVLSMENTPDGWKLDWEKLVNYPHFAWQSFYEGGESSPAPLQVLALRGSASSEHFRQANLSPDTGLAVRLDGPKPGLSVLIIVPKASDLGRLLQRELTWEHARAYRCSLRLSAPRLTPPLAEIREFAGPG